MKGIGELLSSSIAGNLINFEHSFSFCYMSVCMCVCVSLYCVCICSSTHISIHLFLCLYDVMCRLEYNLKELELPSHSAGHRD